MVPKALLVATIATLGGFVPLGVQCCPTDRTKASIVNGTQSMSSFFLVYWALGTILAGIRATDDVLSWCICYA